MTQQDVDLDGLTLRVYQPETEQPENGWPTLLYLHGGGWNMGGLDSHDWFAYEVARRLHIAIVAVAYRLAPEHPYPAALQDSLTALRTLRTGRVLNSLSSDRLVVCGESAGGTLAAALCMALRESGEKQPLGQALLYPVLTAFEDLSSAHECADAPFLTSAAVRASIEGYLPDRTDWNSPLAMPLAATDYTALPPTFIGVAQFDSLRDHGIEYHHRLLEAGIDSRLYIGQGLVHGCLRDDSIPEVAALYEQFIRHVADFLTGA
ncbi:alpha/beta hydrolase [Pseudomonas sp. GM102]|uniref:alpha/beta hydrolase n=1 Tax=Pseudomonas sp. GM102 TaxID=1144321 RepID=UPI001EE6751C|nr:alpha/beta hydrolase [Pseudomonas sp. GM102]